MKEKGILRELPTDRPKAGISSSILGLLRTEALTIKEIREKLNIKSTTAYNAIRRLEKRGSIVAFDQFGRIVFVEKKKAKEEGLLQ